MLGFQYFKINFPTTWHLLLNRYDNISHYILLYCPYIITIGFLPCNWLFAKRGSLLSICWTVSLLERPQRALQAKALMLSASVIGVFTINSNRRVWTRRHQEKHTLMTLNYNVQWSDITKLFDKTTKYILEMVWGSNSIFTVKPSALPNIIH